MKALILTHPIGANYGGIMQCFALKTVLERIGYSVDVIDFRHNPYYKESLKQFLQFLGYHRLDLKRYDSMKGFVKEHIHQTKTFYNSKALTKYLKKNPVDAIIVGSDQVWKTAFASSYGYSYYLDFVPQGIKKVAYAASVGTRIKWSYNSEQTEKIKRLLRSFSGISVRESDAAELYAKEVGVTPMHVLDPTMLLNASDYEPLLEDNRIHKKYIFVYWLWNKEAIDAAISEVNQRYDYEIIVLSMRESKKLVSIGEWLSLIKNAEYVITDSFHGCSFCITFNRPFKYVHSPEVYDSRRESILKMLLINSDEMIPGDNSNLYSAINLAKKEHQEKSLEFIKESLKCISLC